MKANAFDECNSSPRTFLSWECGSESSETLDYFTACLSVAQKTSVEHSAMFGFRVLAPSLSKNPTSLDYPNV